MILRCLFILLFISFFHDSFAQNKFDIANVKQLGLITVDITTVNGEIPTCDYVSAPEGSMGHTSCKGGEIYNLYGIKVKSPHKGLFISNSNKIIVR